MFSLPDPRRALRRVALLHELVRPRDVEFERSDGGFELELPRPPVDRLEYLLAVEDRDGDTQVGPDPANPLQADGPFGPKSVVEFPEYSAARVARRRGVCDRRAARGRRSRDASA